VTKRYLNQALTASGGSIQRAAPLLGISYRTMRYLIGKYDLNRSRKAINKVENREEDGRRETKNGY